MPRPKRPRTGPNSLTASAARITAQTGRGIPARKPARSWQDEAWRFLDITGELSYVASYISNAISRVTLTVDLPNQAGTGRVDVTDPNDPAVKVMAGLFDGEAGQPQMMGALGLHLFVVGESWLFGVYDPPPGTDPWRVLPHTEVRQRGTLYEVDRGDGVVETYESAGELPECIAIRIWRPHPAKWVEATGPVRAAIPILSELEGLTKRTAAIIDSRLAGNGVFVVPSEATFASPGPVPGALPGAEYPADDPRNDPFLRDLMTAMLTPIADPGDASAVVPLLLKAPGQYLDKIQHLTFSSDLDKESRERTDALMVRLARALDAPPEILLGQADSNHWTGWLINEDVIRIHVEPPVELLANAILTQYVWPALEAAGHPNPWAYGLHGDTSALRQRPDKSDRAIALAQMGRLGDPALLRETGFDAADLPTADEERRWLLEQIIKSNNPDLIQAALQALGITLTPPAIPVSTGGQTSPQAPAAIEAPTTPAVPASPAAGPPAGGAAPSAPTVAPPPVAAAAVLASAQLLIGRAVERANNRLNGRRRQRGPIQDTDAIHDALTDAWGAVPQTAALLGVDPGALQERLSAYTVRLLQTGQEHDPAALGRLLAPLTRDAAA